MRAIAIGPKGEVYAIANDIKAASYAPRRKGKGVCSAGPTDVHAAARRAARARSIASRPNGAPEQLLDDTDEHYTALAIGDDGRPYVGTGAEGRIYTVDEHHDSMLVADVEERMIGALALAGKQRFIGASDPAVLHPVRGTGGPDAVWTSKVLDAGLRARFGRMTWDATGTVELSTRTGNTKDVGRQLERLEQTHGRSRRSREPVRRATSRSAPASAATRTRS